MRHAEAYRDHNRAEGLSFRGQSFSGVTGTMAAALANAAAVFAARYPLAATNRFLVQWVHLHYVTLAAYTTPLTAGRSLICKRGSGGDASNGTDISVVRDQSDLTAETLLTGQAANTGALTMTSVSFETPVKARLLLAQAGNAGNDYDEIWTFDDPFILLPGQLLGILAGQLFDAVGTWQLNVKGHGVEVP
jgi:hypothetical protein